MAAVPNGAYLILQRFVYAAFSFEKSAGFRRGDGIGDTHATIAGTWRDWAIPAAPAGACDVTLLCREMKGAWRGIADLLEEIGLRVTARWPANGNTAETARLGNGRLIISVDMEY